MGLSDGMGLSAADVAAVTNGNNGFGFGGDGAWWLLILFLFAFGGGNWGNGYGGYYDDHRYSRHSIKDRMISKLESMYDDAKTDHEKQIVDEWIRRIGSES